MANRIHKEKETSSGKSATVEETPDTLAVDEKKKDKIDGDVDAILDEIDDVLEVNAEDFVKSFIQKGGE